MGERGICPRFPAFLRPVVVGERDTEDAIPAKSGGETLDEAPAFERALLRAGKPGGIAGNERQDVEGGGD